MADTTLDDLNLTQIELLQKYNDALNKFSVINDLIVDGRIAEAENALKLNGLKLYATVNEDGSFNDDGIFKIKEVNGQKNLFGILDINMYVKPVTSTLDIFSDGSCVALFEFEGNTNDTGGIYNGTWRGTPNYENGKIGMAASFDGSSLIELPRDIYNADYINYPIAISAWVYLKASETDAVVYNTGGYNNGLGFGIRNNKIYGAVQNNEDSTPYDNLYGDTQLENETWYFITMVFDGSTKEMKLYVNSKLDASKTMTVYPGDRSDAPFIGGINSSSSTFYDDSNTHYTRCLIDHIRFFKNKLLTDDEVKILYNEGA